MVTETPAVTVTESAPVIEQEVSLQDRLNAATEDEYKTWERTGEIPAVKPKAAEPPPKREVTAPSTESSATEPEKKPVETAPATEPGKPQKKRTGDARILQLLEERKQIDEERKREREENARRFDELEKRLAKPAEVKTEAAVEVKADQEPTIDGINAKTGKQFQTIAEWQKEHTAWLRNQILLETRGELTKSEQQRAQSERERSENEGFANKLTVGKDKYSDFEKVAFNPDLPIPKGSPADIFIRQAENPADLLYYLGQHPEVLHGFYRYVAGKDDAPGKLTGVFEQLISPNLQMMQLAKIEATLSQSVPKVTPAPRKQLPEPPTILAANSSAPGDPVEDALKRKSFADYEKSVNASERKARRA